MHSFWTPFTLAFLATLTSAQDSTLVTLYDGANCSSEASQYLWEPGAHDATSDGGDCVQALPATAFSLMFSEFLPGCTATVYSDVYCSYNATLAELNACVDLGDGLKIRSFSIDGCDVPFFESGNTTNTTTTTLPPPVAQSTGGLSSATKGGIAAGVICGVLLLVGILVAFWLKRRRSKVSKVNVIVPNNSKDHSDQPAELSGEQIFELNTARGAEMAAEKEKQEMSSTPIVAELRSKSSVRIVLPQELEGDRPQG